jgi:endonuclease YncB( thermonuclease family)
MCGFVVPPLSITSAVIDVHDGDTITVSKDGSPTPIRLEGIDAPELAQTFGPESRDALRILLLNKTVQVRYSDTDKYGRILGSVFRDDCTYVNLEQLRRGMA